ncbi:YeiH family protein [Macrococcoides bohemicum]|uniref:YeiH family protein n=1 Tax=Macrococcoides bohemicum TaxID=1903056 RepID=UPI00193FE3F5|nr:YeiH family protein [Macrococcus bohemicus]QRN50751.1 YeiH family putative sulfate export transporter [Macrococcus bohemicus]QYA44597.1 YeiH family protein [Macrococcus bohemicus]
MKRHGVILCSIIAVIATLLGQLFPIIGGIIFSIILGIIISNAIKLPDQYQPGIKFASKKILQYAIIVMGFTLNLRVVVEMGLSSLPITLTTITAALLTSVWLGKVMNIGENIRTLIGVGTAICGGSAIAAASPIVDAKEDEIAFSLSTIFLFNIIAVFIFPVIGHTIGLSDIGFGHFAGTAINDTSSVVAAGYAYSETAGDTATIIKLVRALMIIPVCLILVMVQLKKSEKRAFSIKKVFPWFILYFFLASVVTSIINLPEAIISYIKMLSTFMISIAMAGIGLSVSIKQFRSIGIKPVLLGASVWFVVAGISLIMQWLLNIW